MNHAPEIIRFILEDIILFHEQMEKNFVMEKGIHDIKLLESAVNAPFQTFAGQDLYPDIIGKAARLCFGLAKDHPFRDGNKRTAVHSMLVYLDINDIELTYSMQDIESIIIGVADGSVSSDELTDWLKCHITKD